MTLGVPELLAVFEGLTPCVKEEVGERETVGLPDSVVVGVVDPVPLPVELEEGVGVLVPLSLPVALGLVPTERVAVGLAVGVGLSVPEGL